MRAICSSTSKTRFPCDNHLKGFLIREVKIQKEQQNHLQLGIFEKSQVHETHAQTSFQAPKDLPTHPWKFYFGHFDFWCHSGPLRWWSSSGGVSDVKIDFSGTNRIWMGVRGTDMGGPPIAKSVEFSSVPGREGHHLLGQSLRSANPLFAALFGFSPHTFQL